MGVKNVKRHSYLLGFMWSDSIVKSTLNLTGIEKDLSTMTIFQKIIYFKNYSKKVHRTNRNDVFYCYYDKSDTVLSHYSNIKFIFYRKKIELLFVLKFYHDRNTVNFVKELQFVSEFDTIDKIGLSEIPAVFDRKLYEYRTKTGATFNKFIEAKDNDWPSSKGSSVRYFSFAFPNASAKLKEHLLLSKNFY